MKKILGLLMGAVCWVNVLTVCAAEKFEILPDLPEPLSAARASSVSTTNDIVTNNIHSVGQEPNIISVVFSLLVRLINVYIARSNDAIDIKIGTYSMIIHHQSFFFIITHYLSYKNCLFRSCLI